MSAEGSPSPLRRPALIFDFGNVVCFFDYARACDRLSGPLGISGQELLEQIRAQGSGKIVAAYESGKLTSREFGRQMASLAGLDVTEDEFNTAWSDIFWPNEPVIRLVAALKRGGYRLVLGSNTNEIHSRFFRRKFAEELGEFDRLVLSFEVGHIKPEAPFYLACAEAAGALPEDCIFIDDLEENVEGARSAGLQGIVYRDDRSLRDSLRAQGVEVPDSPESFLTTSY